MFRRKDKNFRRKNTFIETISRYRYELNELLPRKKSLIDFIYLSQDVKINIGFEDIYGNALQPLIKDNHQTDFIDTLARMWADIILNEVRDRKLIRVQNNLITQSK